MKQPRPTAVLHDWRDDFPESIAQINEFLRDAANQRQRLTQDSTPLSIGIMGQVKAGKSSFLNSLLFGGHCLLPEAVTPKTAALTRIRYGERASFTATFYTPEEWAGIEARAASSHQDYISRAARELVTAVESSGEDCRPLLHLGKFSIEADNMDELMEVLGKYVSSDGQLSPIVAETELTVPLAELKGIEIVDTPGMNDPIVSRTAKTRRYMAQCDVVFFLSIASRFMDANDQALLALQLPQKGVDRLVLVGSKFDMAILDDGFKRDSLDSTTEKLQQQLSLHAQRALEHMAEQREAQEQNDSAAFLRQIPKPIFTSTHAHIVAHQGPEIWRHSVIHTQAELSELAQEKWGAELSDEDWNNIANTRAIREAFAQAISEKEDILQSRRQYLVEKQIQTQSQLLQGLADQAHARLQALHEFDAAALAEQHRRRSEQTEHIAQAIQAFLGQTIATAQEQKQLLQTSITQLAERAEQLEARTGYRRDAATGGGKREANWLKLWSRGKSALHAISSSAYPYLLLADALENLRFYTQSAQAQILSTLHEHLAPSHIQAGLHREIARELDHAEPALDARALQALLGVNLSALQLPEIHMPSPEDHDFFSKFNAEIDNTQDINKLRQELSTALGTLKQESQTAIADLVNGNCRQLQDIQDSIHAQLQTLLEQDHAILQAQLGEKETHIARIQNIFSAIADLETSEQP